MKKSTLTRNTVAMLGGALLCAGSSGWAAPHTITLYAKAVYINPVTGNSGNNQGGVGLGRIPMWGFATSANGVAQVPGPKIDVDPTEFADGLVVTVVNQLAKPISVVIPGLNGSADPGHPVKFGAGDPDFPNRVRSLVPEVLPGGSRSYTWTGPLKVGTYVYHSGTHPALQVQMGLYGMVTVKSSLTEPYPGYTIPATREVPVIFSEIEAQLHWDVATNNYGPGLGVSSTIHGKPDYYLINGRAYNVSPATPNLSFNGARNQPSLFRMINVCWDARIPVLVGPSPTGGSPAPSSGGNYLTAIAEDGNLYPYPRTAYAPNLPSMKTIDFVFTPVAPPGSPLTFTLYDRRLGLSNAGQPNGGMYARWAVQ